MNIRQTVLRSTLFAVGITLLGSFSGAFATDTMVLTGVQGPSMGGVYTSPYTATINGVNTLIICDDFLTDVSIDLSWQATATEVSSLSGTNASTAVKFDQSSVMQQQLNYAVAADLTEEILAQDQSTSGGQYQAGILSYALWDLFDPTLLMTTGSGWQHNCQSNHSYGCLTTQEISDAEAALNCAQGQLSSCSSGEQAAGSYTQYSNVTVYTPTGTPPSQEYLVVSMSEPPSPAILGLYLLGSGGLFFVFRRRSIG